MEKLLTFLNIIAWVGGVTYTLWGLFILWMAWNYPGSIDEMKDKLQGKKKVFRPFQPLGIALVCWAFIIAFW